MIRPLAVALLAVASLAACGGGGGGGAAPTAQPEPTPAPTAQPEPAPAPTAQPEPEAQPQPAPSQSDTIKATLNRLIINADSMIARGGTLPKVGENRALSLLQNTSISGIDFSDFWQLDVDYERLASRRGISFARGEKTNEETRITNAAYVALLEHSFFAVSFQQRYQPPLIDVGQGAIIISSGPEGYSVGSVSKSNPTFEGTWEGVMIGALDTDTLCGRNNYCSPEQARSVGLGNTLTGDASIVFTIESLGSEIVDVAFTNIEDTVTGKRYDAISWNDIPLRNGVFYGADPIEGPRQGSRSHIVGQFYGLLHEEVGGTFYRYNGISGAFGAKRQ